MTGTRTTYWTSTASPVDAGFDAMLWTKTGERWDGTSKLIVGMHGHGGSGLHYTPNHLGMGRCVQELVATGRYVFLATGDRGDTWGGPQAMAACDAAVAWARAKGCRAGAYGLMGYSMGGLAAGNRLRADAANVAATWTWAGAVDAGYVWGAGNASWTTELTGVYGSLAAQRAAASDPLNGAAAYRAPRGPWTVCHAADDAVVAVQCARDLVAAVADPKVTLRELAQGGHTALWPYVPPADVVAFYDSGAW